jgi:DNA replication and repair protein RecF
VGLESLSLKGFRLFRSYELRPDPTAVTVLLSPNGTGKTSVLEAVYALATASSFRTSAAADMIRAGDQVAEVHGVAFAGERRVSVDLTLTRTPSRVQKRMLVNGQRPRSRADLSATLPVTLFTPEGVDMIRHGPDGRRAFLTTLLTDEDLRTGELVERFERTLRQRNALVRSLRGERPGPGAREELDAWSEDFVAVSEEVIEARRRLVAEAGPVVEEKYRELAGEGSEVSLCYETSWRGPLADALAAALDDDLARGYSTIGPHRDDLAITLERRDARRQASQGEQRSLALALRLAGHELVRASRRVSPLLLLDDVFSELDPSRSERLLRLLPEGQTLVTTASPLPRGMEPAAVVSLPARGSS